VIDFYCLFIHRSGLRLKFQDHCEFVDSVHNWLLWLERAFMACWYFEGSCWDLGRLCVGRQFIRLFKRLENSHCVYLKFGFAPLRGFVDCLWQRLFRVVLYYYHFCTELLIHFCGLLGHVLAPQSCTSFSF